MVKHFLATIIKSVNHAHFSFIIICSIIGIIFTQIIPPLWGIDEIQHYKRTVQLAQFDVFPNKLEPNGYVAKYPAGVTELEGQVYADLTSIKPGNLFQRKDLPSYQHYKEITSKKINDDIIEVSNTIPIVYSPVAYLAPTAGVLISKLLNLTIGQSIKLGRLFVLFFYILLTAFSLWLLKDTRLKWLVFVTALLPMSVFQASIFSVDSVITGLCFVILAIVFNSIIGKSLNYYHLSALALAVFSLPLTKLPYFVACFSIFLMPKNSFPEPLRKINLLLKFTAITLFAFISWYWYSQVSLASEEASRLFFPSFDIDIKRQLDSVLGNPLNFLLVSMRTLILNEGLYVPGAAGLLGWNYVGLPYTIIILCYFLILLSSIMKLDGLKTSNQRLRVFGLVVIGFVAIFAVLLTMYLGTTSVGDKTIVGVQGRYFTALFPYIFLLPALISPIKIASADASESIFFNGSMSFLLLFSVFYYIVITF